LSFLEFKTGNVISLFLFGLLLFFIIVALLRDTGFGGFASLSLLSVSALSLASLVYSDIADAKEIKITAVAVFIISTVFLLSLVLVISMSARGELKFFRSIFIFLFISAMGILAVFLNVLNYTDDSSRYNSNERNAESGVILGAAVWGGNRPSPVLRERILKGYEIYKKGIVPKIVITGGGSPNELTEGEVSKNELIKFGVDPDDLILENTSNSTVEQLHFVRDHLYNSLSWKKIIVVSDNFHLLRAKEICSFNDMNADCVASGKELTSGGAAAFCLKESMALIVFWMSGI
jgi:uncharacterized SAM-binding protein YcdF (DUF218 family)